MIILQSAFLGVYRNGFRATSVNDILKKTSLTKGAFYHHFPDKIALGYAIVDELLRWFVDQFWLEPLRKCDDPIARMKEMLMTYKVDEESVMLGCPVNNLAVEMAPVDEGFRARLNGVYDFWRDGIADALRRGVEAGVVSGEIDPVSAATFILASAAGARGLAKNARSVDVLMSCNRSLCGYLDTLRPAGMPAGGER